MTTKCPWCQVDIEIEGETDGTPLKCPDCGGVIQTIGGFEFGAQAGEKPKAERVVSYCPVCGHDIDATGIEDGKVIPCPHPGCGKSLKFSSRRFIYLPPVAVPQKPLFTEGQPKVKTRHERLGKLRSNSGWIGTRRVFGAFAILGAGIGGIAALAGLASMAINPDQGVVIFVWGISSAVISFCLWLIVRLLTDIADMLLGPDDE